VRSALAPTAEARFVRLLLGEIIVCRAGKLSTHRD
jgi:hypothetical protein